MTFTEVVSEIFVQTIANIVSNLAWFILIYWGVKTIVKEVPGWINQYEQSKLKIYSIERAMGKR